MKIKHFYSYFIISSIVLWGCNGKNEEPVKIVSIGDIAIQSIIERTNSSDSVDSVWIDELITLHEMDQRVCFLAAESAGENLQKSALAGGGTSAQGNRNKAVQVMEACCPCNGGCCGCDDQFLGASSDDVSGLTLTNDSTKESYTATPKPVGKITTFKFESTIPNGTYTMTIQRGNKKPITFKIEYEDAKWSIEKAKQAGNNDNR